MLHFRLVWMPCDLSGQKGRHAVIMETTIKMMTAAEAAEYLGITPQAVNGLCQRDRLRSVMVGGARLIDALSLCELSKSAEYQRRSRRPGGAVELDIAAELRTRYGVSCDE
jgi:excisionase family DNA binding protein